MAVAFGRCNSDSLYFSVFSKFYNFYHCGKAETHTTREHTILINLITVNLSGDFCFVHLIYVFDKQQQHRK